MYYKYKDKLYSKDEMAAFSEVELYKVPLVFNPNEIEPLFTLEEMKLACVQWCFDDADLKLFFKQQFNITI